MPAEQYQQRWCILGPELPYPARRTAALLHVLAEFCLVSAGHQHLCIAGRYSPIC